MSKPESTIKIETNDEKFHDCPLSVVNECTTLKNMVEDMRGMFNHASTKGADTSHMDLAAPIPLPNMDSEIYQLVVDLTKILLKEKSQTDNPKAKGETSQLISTKIQSLDLVWLNDLLNSCDYLCNEMLLDRTCEEIAETLNNKTPDEIREMFGLEDDLSPEEKEEIKKKYKWILES